MLLPRNRILWFSVHLRVSLRLPTYNIRSVNTNNSPYYNCILYRLSLRVNSRLNILDRVYYKVNGSSYYFTVVLRYNSYHHLILLHCVEWLYLSSYNSWSHVLYTLVYFLAVHGMWSSNSSNSSLHVSNYLSLF